jgi:hypothetical protein
LICLSPIGRIADRKIDSGEKIPWRPGWPRNIAPKPLSDQAFGLKAASMTVQISGQPGVVDCPFLTATNRRSISA